MVMTIKHRLRLCEVPVTMREREHGRSSITALRSIYYMAKVLIALFVGLFRRRVVAAEDADRRRQRRSSLARGDGRVADPRARRLRADPLAPAARAVCAALAAHRVVLVILSAWRGGLNTIAGWLGVRGYPPAVLFAVGLLFVILVLLHYSTVISRLSDQNVVLAQRLALLETKLEERSDR